MKNNSWMSWLYGMGSLLNSSVEWGPLGFEHDCTLQCWLFGLGSLWNSLVEWGHFGFDRDCTLKCSRWFSQLQWIRSLNILLALYPSLMAIVVIVNMEPERQPTVSGCGCQLWHICYTVESSLHRALRDLVSSGAGLLLSPKGRPHPSCAVKSAGNLKPSPDHKHKHKYMHKLILSKKL